LKGQIRCLTFERDVARLINQHQVESLVGTQFAFELPSWLTAINSINNSAAVTKITR
jgi:hypothetical protein